MVRCCLWMDIFILANIFMIPNQHYWETLTVIYSYYAQQNEFQSFQNQIKRINYVKQ